MSAQDDKIKKTYSEPYFTEIDGYSERVRRNLIAFSIVGILFAIFPLETENFSFFGLTFSHLEKKHFMYGILICVIYHLFHFLVCFWDYFIRAANRIYKKDYSNFNAYKYFLDFRSDLIDTQEISNFINHIKSSSNYGSAEATSIRLLCENVLDLLDSKNSNNFYMLLQQFDIWFWRHQKIQAIRMIVFELGLPIIIALYSIYQLSTSNY